MISFGDFLLLLVFIIWMLIVFSALYSLPFIKNFIKGSCSINKAQEDIQELKRNYANISEGLSSIDLADKEPVHKIYSRIVNKSVVLNSPTSLLLRSRAALLVEQSKSNPSKEGEYVAKLKVLDSKLDLQLYKRS